MQYFGGKHFTAEKITAVMKQMIKPGQIYLEPFVGAGHIVEQMKCKTRYASDSNPYLIAMYQALQEGWQPPNSIGEELYVQLRKQTGKQKQDGPQIPLNETPDFLDDGYQNALIGFAGHACSFAGIWFGSYARDPRRFTNFCEKGKNSLLKGKFLDNIRTVKFTCKNYFEWKPKNAFIYCDPPYGDTHQPYFSRVFDTARFWDTMREWSKNNTVVISEYNAPDDFNCIAEILTRTQVECTKQDSARIEKVFSMSEKPDPFRGIFD